MKKYIPSVIIFGVLGFLAFSRFQDEGLFLPKQSIPKQYANMTAADLPKLQQELLGEARAIREKSEKMEQIFLDLPDDRTNLTDEFFISRGTTKGEFLEYYDLPESELYD